MKKAILQSIFVFFALFSFFGCQPKKVQEVETKDMNSVYKFDTVRLRNFEQELQFTGQVSFDQKQVDRVYSVVSGNVLEVTAELGSYVSKGQVLAKVQSADVSGYLKDYNTAKSNYDLAKRNADNTEQLYKTKFSSENELISARKQLEIASSELERSSQVLKLYGGTTKIGSSNAQPIFTVQAPVSGYVVERNINPNVQIRPDNGDPLFTISNLADVWVMINIYESDIEAVKVGQQVNITTIAYPEKIFKGTIQNIGQVIDNDSKVLQARVVLQNPNGILKPDMFCTIKLHIEKPEKLLSVNPKSVIFSEDQYYVVKDLGQQQFKVIPIEVVKSTSKYDYVKGDIKERDHVVTEGALLIFNDLH